MAEFLTHNGVWVQLTSKLISNAPLRGDNSATAQCSLLREVEEDIDKIEHALVHLRRQRNVFVPISRLPPEIISHIFLFVVLSSNAKDIEEYLWHPSITISQVCYHWRQVAHANPRMWVNIPLIIEEENTCAFIQRSCSMPIHLRISSDEQTYTSAVLQKHIHRVESIALVLETEERDFFTTFFEHIPLPAPLLRTLKVQFNSSDRDPGDSPQFPAHLSHDDVPMLRSISLCGMSLSPSSFSFTGIEALDLHFVDLPPMAQLSSFLTSLPLKTLIIAYCSLSSTPVTPPTHAARLPYLSTLRVAGRSFLCIYLLTMIKLSPTCNLQIACNASVWDNSDGDWENKYGGMEARAILDFISTHLKQLPLALLQTVSFETADVERRSDFDLKIWRTGAEGEDPFDPFAPAEEPLVTVRVYRLMSRFIPTVQKILHFLPLRSVRFMSLSLLYNLTYLMQQDLYDLLAPYVSLEHLRVQKAYSSTRHPDLCYLSPIITASLDTVSESTSPATVPTLPLFLPNLITLELDVHCMKGLSARGDSKSNSAFYKALFSPTTGPRHLRQVIFRSDNDCHSECVQLQSLFPNTTISSKGRIERRVEDSMTDTFHLLS